MTYVRPAVRAMGGYQYGEQPDDDSVVKLNTNENPFPPSPAVARALREFDPGRLNRYPNADAWQLRELLAERHGVEPDQIVVTNGGDEGIRLLFTTCLDVGDVVATTDPSYTLYQVLAEISGCTVHWTPFTAGFALPSTCGAEWRRAGAKLACLVNPHSPSGRLFDIELVNAIAEQLDGVLLIDEAYVDFVDPEIEHNVMDCVNHRRNVVVLRTLSKSHSLAGMRVGYLIGNQDLMVEIAEKTRDSYNVDALAQVLAAAALEDDAYKERTCGAIRTERGRLTQSLQEMGFEVIPSQSNFLLALNPSKQSLLELQRRLANQGILVRHFDTPGLTHGLRISVGTTEENDAFLSALANELEFRASC